MSQDAVPEPVQVRPPCFVIGPRSTHDVRRLRRIVDEASPITLGAARSIYINLLGEEQGTAREDFRPRAIEARDDVVPERLMAAGAQEVLDGGAWSLQEIRALT